MMQCSGACFQESKIYTYIHTYISQEMSRLPQLMHVKIPRATLSVLLDTVVRESLLSVSVEALSDAQTSILKLHKEEE